MIGLIGGTGLGVLEALEVERELEVLTRDGQPSARVRVGRLYGEPVAFLPRHGDGHKIPPHYVNYRANLGALRLVGASAIIGLNAVGGISPACGPASLVIPDQVLDLTHGRAHTRYDRAGSVEHVEFAEPYDRDLRLRLIAAARSAQCGVAEQGCYAATNGPRLETIAEIEWLKRAGADVVGMTGMPEAALGREFGLPYACISVVANWAAGLDDRPITMDEVLTNMRLGAEGVGRVLAALMRA